MSKPRHKPGEYPAYDRLFNYLSKKSLVLTPTSATINGAALEMATGTGLSHLVTEYEGRLERAEALVQTIDGQFEQMQASARSEGKPPQEIMPAHLQKEKHEAEARADVRKLEVELLRRLKAEAGVHQEAQRAHALLPYGPRGNRKGTTIYDPASRTHQVVPVKIIDGQNVEIINGTPYITDKASPYNGLKVSTYWEKIVTPWVATHRDGTVPVRREDLPARP